MGPKNNEIRPIEIPKQTELKDKKSHLNGISIEEMKVLMHLKRQSRLKKRKDFNCIVCDQAAFEVLLKQLKENLSHLPEGTRFQVAVCANRDYIYRENATIGVEHWLLVDCFVKDKNLHSLTVDAFNIKEKLRCQLDLLTRYFPKGHHYFFNDNHGSIQSSAGDCQTFAREHAMIISDINADTLYKQLEYHAHQGADTNLKYFSLNDIKQGKLKELLPLFRGIQSLKRFESLPLAVKNQRVSSKGYSLQQWVEMNTVPDGKDGKLRNVSILFKDHKYAADLATFKKSSNEDRYSYYGRSGLGYITILARLTPYLAKFEIAEIKATISDLISYLEKTPKFRNNYLFGNFFQLKAAHLDKTNETLKQLDYLLQECDVKKANVDTIKDQFRDVLECYADYLVDANSVRCLQLLNEFVNQIINKSSQVNEMSIDKMVICVAN